MLGDSSPLTFDEPFVLVAAFVIGTIAVARMTRLIVDDSFPPVEWMREHFVRRMPEKWGVLVECPWCVAPYITLVDIAWAWSTGLHWSWWFGNLWAAVAWLAAWMTLRDIPPDQR